MRVFRAFAGGFGLVAMVELVWGWLVGGGFGGCRCLVVGLLFGCFSGFSFMRLRFCVFDFVTFCVLDWWFSVAGV